MMRVPGRDNPLASADHEKWRTAVCARLRRLTQTDVRKAGVRSRGQMHALLYP